MGYVVGASELIPTLKPSSKPYNVAILPQGPHFYTWLLQAAGYLLLDTDKKNMLIISQQIEYPEDILIDHTTYGPILGKNLKNTGNNKALLAHELGAKTVYSQEQLLLGKIDVQLPFLRVITDTEEIIHISVGKNITQEKLKKILHWIKKHISDYTIVLLTNIELDQSTKKVQEQEEILKIVEKSSIPLLVLFQKILSTQKKKPEIIAYVNPGEFWGQSSKTTRYICAVG